MIPMILLVEDDAATRELIHEFLEEEAGYRVVTAVDGTSALASLAYTAPNLILLDLVMPRMNGYQFLDALRATPPYQRLPVLVMTTTPPNPDHLSRLNIQGFCQKPCDLGDLLAEVQRLVGSATK